MNKLMWLLITGWMSGACAGIRLNEVCYDPQGTDTDQEWIELINTGGQAVSLSGWLLDCNGPNYLLPDLALAPGQVLLIHSNASIDQPHSQNEVWFTGASLANTHGFLGLWSNSEQVVGNLVDYLEYGASGHSWEGQAVEAGVWPLGAFLPDVEQGHSLRFRGEGVGLGAWLDEPEPEPGQGSTEVGVPDGAVGPGTPQLIGAWPNPFNPSTRVRFFLPEAGMARLRLMDLLGREVRLLVSEPMEPGVHERIVSLGDRPAGPYFLSLEASGARAVSKILLVK